jgi:hypothetical protein
MPPTDTRVMKCHGSGDECTIFGIVAASRIRVNCRTDWLLVDALTVCEDIEETCISAAVAHLLALRSPVGCSRESRFESRRVRRDLFLRQDQKSAKGRTE